MSDLLAALFTLCKIVGASMLVGFGFAIGAFCAAFLLGIAVRYRPDTNEWVVRRNEH